MYSKSGETDPFHCWYGERGDQPNEKADEGELHGEGAKRDLVWPILQRVSR